MSSDVAHKANRLVFLGGRKDLALGGDKGGDARSRASCDGTSAFGGT